MSISQGYVASWGKGQVSHFPFAQNSCHINLGFISPCRLQKTDFLQLLPKCCMLRRRQGLRAFRNSILLFSVDELIHKTLVGAL